MFVRLTRRSGTAAVDANILALQWLVAFVALMFCAILSLGTASAAVNQDKRVALVVGIAKYDNVESLTNPENDSAAMRDALQKLGFQVFFGTDLTLDQFEELAGRYKAAAQDAGTALFYYSGHGFQLKGRNYLVPRDAKLRDVAAIASETVRLDTFLADIQSDDRSTIVFLDACRNSPLPPAQRQETGLAQLEKANGVFVAFATQPGNISYDGRSTLSPFTKALTRFITVPRQSVSDMMIEVRNEVEKQTLFQQTPWDQSSLKRQFYFNGAPSVVDAGQGDDQQVAALDPGSDVATMPRSTGIGQAALPLTSNDNVLVVPGAGGTAPGVIVIPEAPIDVFGPEDLVYGMQTEMQRIGCYVGDIDGVWSAGSRDALSRYYATKKMKLQVLEPDQFHYDNLKREDGTVCKYVPPAAPRVSSGGGGGGSSSAGPRRSQAAAPALGPRRKQAAAAPAQRRSPAGAAARSAPKTASSAPAPAATGRKLSGRAIGAFR